MASSPLRVESPGEFTHNLKSFAKFQQQIAFLRQRVEHGLPFLWGWIKFFRPDRGLSVSRTSHGLP